MSDSEQVHSEIGQDDFKLLSDEVREFMRTLQPVLIF